MTRGDVEAVGMYEYLMLCGVEEYFELVREYEAAPVYPSELLNE